MSRCGRMWLVGLAFPIANVVSWRVRFLPLTKPNKPAETTGSTVIQPPPGGYWLVDFLSGETMEHWKCCRWITSKVGMCVLCAWHVTFIVVWLIRLYNASWQFSISQWEHSSRGGSRTTSRGGHNIVNNLATPTLVKPRPHHCCKWHKQPEMEPDFFTL